MLSVVTTDNLFPEKYKKMVYEITEYFPILDKATDAFNKTQSQFMDNMLTLSSPTGIRNARQVLAEIKKSRLALEEASFIVTRKNIELDRKLNCIDKENNTYSRRMLEVDVRELQTQIKNITDNIQGAIRRVHNYTIQYKQILVSLGKEELTEEDFELDESRYHVMKAFEQALCAARSRGGIVDEGNHIYFHQIGINGAVAQLEITEYFRKELSLMDSKKAPTHEMQTEWLKTMGDKYVEYPLEYAKRKGVVLISKSSLHSIEGEQR